MAGLDNDYIPETLVEYEAMMIAFTRTPEYLAAVHTVNQLDFIYGQYTVGCCNPIELIDVLRDIIQEHDSNI